MHNKFCACVVIDGGDGAAVRIYDCFADGQADSHAFLTVDCKCAAVKSSFQQLCDYTFNNSKSVINHMKNNKIFIVVYD